MSSSKTSSIASASKNIALDGASVSNLTVFGAAAVDTIANSAAVPFARSKILGRGTNPKTNEGIVHLIHKLWIEKKVLGAVAGEAGASSRIQIHRRDPGAGAPDFVQSGNPIEQVAFEDVIADKVWQSSRGTAAAQVFISPAQNKVIHEFRDPIVMVQPYYLKVSSVMNSAVVQSMIDQVTMYLWVESIRVKGEQYRRLLDNYTRFPVTAD